MVLKISASVSTKKFHHFQHCTDCTLKQKNNYNKILDLHTLMQAYIMVYGHLLFQFLAMSINRFRLCFGAFGFGAPVDFVVVLSYLQITNRVVMYGCVLHQPTYINIRQQKRNIDLYIYIFILRMEDNFLNVSSKTKSKGLKYKRKNAFQKFFGRYKKDAKQMATSQH